MALKACELLHAGQVARRDHESGEEPSWCFVNAQGAFARLDTAQLRVDQAWLESGRVS